jgi:hypothetical protein
LFFALAFSASSSFICSMLSVMDIVTAPMKSESMTIADTTMKNTKKSCVSRFLEVG